MKEQTVQNSYMQPDGTVWEWVETPELGAFVAQQKIKNAEEILNDQESDGAS
jgi:hypothetical protein